MITMFCIKRGWDEHFAVWYASWYENVRLHNADVRLVVFECGDRDDCARTAETIREIGAGGSVIDWSECDWVRVIERCFGRVLTDDDFCIPVRSINYALARLEALDWLSGKCKGDIICHVDLDTLFVRRWVNISKQLRYWVDKGAEMVGVDEWCCSKDYLIDMHPAGWGDGRLNYINGGLIFFMHSKCDNVKRFTEWLSSKDDLAECRCLEQDWINDPNEFDAQRIGILPSRYNFTWNHLRVRKCGYPVMVHYYGDIKPWSVGEVDSCVWKYGFWEEYLGWLSRVRWLVSGEFYDNTVRRILTVTSELRSEFTKARSGVVVPECNDKDGGDNE